MFLVVVLSLCLAALANAPQLVETAERQPLGWRRDVVVEVAGAVADLAERTRLDRPRRWIEQARDPDVVVAPPTTAPAAPVPTTAPTPEAPAPSEAPASASTTVPTRRRPSASDPLRVRIVGDSMMQVVGQSLVNGWSADDAVAAALDYRVSTGLSRPDYFDWPGRLAELLAAEDPEVLVVLFGANDAQGIVTAAGAESFGTDAWLAEYRSRVAAVMDLVTADARRVYWIGQPIMRSERFSARMAALNEIYRTEAERRPEVVYVDSWSLFAADGGYSAYLDLGGPTLVRQGDGIHLTRAGGDRLAGVVLDIVRRDWFEEES